MQHSVDRVVEVAQCERELAAQMLLVSRGDVGAAIGRIIEGLAASGGAGAASARQPQEEEDDRALELGLADLDSGGQLSPTLLAQQQALLVSIPTFPSTVSLALGVQHSK